MSEKTVQFGNFRTLVGVVSEPDSLPAEDRPAVVLSNAGLIHRIGPNRVYVKLARLLARQGFLVLRFDLSGVGDSQPRRDHLPVERFTIDDVCQAMDFLSERYGSRDFVLMGHCAGAYHSFRTAAEQARVTGVVMMNPDGGEADWVEYDRKRKLARYYENYYGKKTLLDANHWKRFFRGQISYRSVFNNIFRNVLWNRVSGMAFRLRQRFGRKQPAFADEKLFTIEAILQRLDSLDTRVLLIYSEGSTSLERARTTMGKAIHQLQSAGKLQLTVIPGADHIFSPLNTQAELLQKIAHWMA